MRDVTPFFKQKAGKARRGSKAAAMKKARAEVVERSQGRCEAAIEGVCVVQGSQVHHKRRRSQGGTDTVDNLILVCHRCHDHIHRYPAQATELGLLTRTFTPASGLLNVTKVGMAGSDCPCRSCCNEAMGTEALLLPMIVCRKCGNKRCPHAAHHTRACTGSNDTGQFGSDYP